MLDRLRNVFCFVLKEDTGVVIKVPYLWVMKLNMKIHLNRNYNKYTNI